MSAVAVSPERAALIQRLHEALDALERGDETSMRAVIDALASARTRPRACARRRASTTNARLRAISPLVIASQCPANPRPAPA